MSVTFTSARSAHTLHLCSNEAGKLLKTVGVDTSVELRGFIPPDTLITRIKAADASALEARADGMNWKEDPDIGDLSDGLRRLAIIAAESGELPVRYR